MTLRSFLARCVRIAATRIDAIETPHPVERASLAESATKARAIADRLDPRVTTCVVCGEQLSAAMTEEHACAPEAMAAWHARMVERIDSELDS